MSIIDLIKNNTVATVLATAITGGAVIYVVVPGGGGKFPDRFEVTRSDGGQPFTCDLSAFPTCQSHNRPTAWMIKIKRHPGDPDLVMIDGHYGIIKTGVTWEELSKAGVTLPARTTPYDGLVLPEVKITAKK